MRAWLFLRFYARCVRSFCDCVVFRLKVRCLRLKVDILEKRVYSVVTGHVRVCSVTMCMQVIVESSGQLTLPAFFSYGSPTISALSPTSGVTQGGVTGTLTGDSFGAELSLISVELGGIECLVVGVTGHDTITFTLPVGTGVDRDVVVTVAGQVHTVCSIYSQNLNFYISKFPG